MTNRQYLSSLRTPTAEAPLRILVSACLTGIPCGVDATPYGEYPSVLKLLGYRNVKLIRFCPEDFSFGTPREMCDIHGGTGHDVLDGRARVLTASGIDWTAGMIAAAEKMLELANRESAELAILMDTSAACGSQVIYDGNRYAANKIYQIGAGVAAARLKRAGYEVISQRDYASLELLYQKIDPQHIVHAEAVDHHETEWYQSYFKQAG